MTNPPDRLLDVTHPPRTIAELRTALRAAGSPLRRSIGQHFLIERSLRDALLEDAAVAAGESVLEVGVGVGVLSEGLLAKGARVFAVEVDRRMIEISRQALAPSLVEVVVPAGRVRSSEKDAGRLGASQSSGRSSAGTLAGESSDGPDSSVAAIEEWLSALESGQLLLLQADALRRKALHPLVETGLGVLRRRADAPLRLVANLPYQIASPLLISLLEWRSPEGLGGIDGFAALVQREVAERMIAEPGSGGYGTLSVLIQAHADVSIGRVLKPSVFYPPPKVDSAFVVGRVRSASARPFGLDLAGYDRWKRLVGGIFQYRRKHIRRGLSHVLGAVAAGDAKPRREGRSAEAGADSEPGTTAARIDAALAAAKIDPIRRGETLSGEEFRALAEALAPDLADRNGQ